jgi:hypothetical protein
MRKIYTVLYIAIIALGLFPATGFAANRTIKFITSGNCIICKERIEYNVKKLEGLKYANWEPSNKETLIMYDEATLLNPHIIMKAIAAVGHDTEWYRAPDEVYNTLKGTCCEYTRDIDYTKVQIGYLKLMDLWLSVDDTPIQDIIIYPSVITNGSLNIASVNNQLTDINVSVFALDGSVAYSNKYFNLDNAKIDVSGLPSACYFVLVSDNKQNVISKTKIIVQ